MGNHLLAVVGTAGSYHHSLPRWDPIAGSGPPIVHSCPIQIGSRSAATEMGRSSVDTHTGLEGIIQLNINLLFF